MINLSSVLKIRISVLITLILVVFVFKTDLLSLGSFLFRSWIFDLSLRAWSRYFRLRVSQWRVGHIYFASFITKMGGLLKIIWWILNSNSLIFIFFSEWCRLFSWFYLFNRFCLFLCFTRLTKRLSFTCFLGCWLASNWNVFLLWICFNFLNSIEFCARSNSQWRFQIFVGLLQSLFFFWV